jgi:hypothetical protein
MASPKAEITRILREKMAGIKTGTQAMLKILEELRRQVIDEVGRASLESFDYHRLKQMVPAIEYQIKNFKEKAELEAAGLLERYWGMGQNLVDAGLGASQIQVGGFGLSASALDAMKEFTFNRIKGLSADAMTRIETELHLGVLGQKTPQEVAKAIGMNLKDPSIFKNITTRAETITETEMGRVFSQAAQYRMEEAAGQVEGLQKEWRHVGHPKVPRAAHLAANGQKVDVDKPFIIGGIPMMFPRDPQAPLSEIINCG